MKKSPPPLSEFTSHRLKTIIYFLANVALTRRLQVSSSVHGGGGGKWLVAARVVV
jgi:hypothetical protein